MERVLKTSEILEAWNLSKQGKTLEQIMVLMGLTCSRTTLWRYIREATTSDERIETAMRTGKSDLLDLGEALAFLKRAPQTEGYRRLLELEKQNGPTSD